MKILVDSSIPSLSVADLNEKRRVIKYDIVSEGEVVGSIHRCESVETWGIAVHEDFTFSVGFIGRLIQVMMEYQGPA